MNTTSCNNDSPPEVTVTDFDGRSKLESVETSIALRRPNSNGDKNIPTGPPPNQDAAKKRFCQTLTARQCGSATTIRAPQLPRNFEQIRHRAREIYRARRGITGMMLNDWLKAEQYLKQKLIKKQITRVP